jgi:transcriptional regulator of acetoin/glycerol metabolism
VWGPKRNHCTNDKKSSEDGHHGRAIRESHQETHTKAESKTFHTLHGKLQRYQETEKKKPREKCTFCKNPGHDVSVCRKKIRAEQENGQTKATKNELRCYGCGQPGVIKRNCTKCSPPQPSDPTMAFNAINVEILEWPAVDIEIYGFPGTAFLDSGARKSLANLRLQDIFVKMNLPLQERTARVVLATGNSQVQTVRTVTVPVKLKGRTFQTPFVCAQGGADAVTLLGTDFARIAGLVIDFYNDSYNFHGLYNPLRCISLQKAPVCSPKCTCHLPALN